MKKVVPDLENAKCAGTKQPSKKVALFKNSNCGATKLPFKRLSQNKNPGGSGAAFVLGMGVEPTLALLQTGF
jgi:hypothetical protein